MKFAWLFGVVAALVLHAGFLAFGGLLLPEAQAGDGRPTIVDIVDEHVDEAKKQDEQQEPEPEQKELDTREDPPPDATEILKALDAPPSDDAPALEAASLSAIEAALSGRGGGGDFSDALGFASGGRIGGTGVPGGKDRALDDAFSLADLDQKPRAVFQSSPVYPAQMRGKKVEGVVHVIFVVDANGKVENPRVESSSHQAFEGPALDAVRKWKFEPGVRAGERVSSKMRVPIRFPAS